MGLKWNIDQIYCNNKSRRPLGHPCNSYNHDWDDRDDDDQNDDDGQNDDDNDNDDDDDDDDGAGTSIWHCR